MKPIVACFIVTVVAVLVTESAGGIPPKCRSLANSFRQNDFNRMIFENLLRSINPHSKYADRPSVNTLTNVLNQRKLSTSRAVRYFTAAGCKNINFPICKIMHSDLINNIERIQYVEAALTKTAELPWPSNTFVRQQMAKLSVNLNRLYKLVGKDRKVFLNVGCKSLKGIKVSKVVTDYNDSPRRSAICVQLQGTTQGLKAHLKHAKGGYKSRLQAILNKVVIDMKKRKC